MLAHELTHVVQQRSGPVEGTPAAGGIKVSNPSDAFERSAESSADRVMSGGAPAPAPASPASVQRQGDDDELQGLFVQREQDDDELQGSFVQRELGDDKEEEEG
jgi:hypothetical protein